MRRTTSAGLRVLVLVTSPAVAVLAVATDSPSAMLLLGVPGAVVVCALRTDHRRTADRTRPAGSARHRPCTDRWTERRTMDETTAGRHQARLLRRGLRHLGLTDHGLWLRYAGRGGSVGELEVEAYLHDSLRLPTGERDLLVEAANALLDRQPRLQVPATRDLLTPDDAEDRRD